MRPLSIRLSSRPVMVVVFALALASSGACRNPPGRLELERDVRLREQAFAKTMADRDGAAFASFVSEEAVFIGARTLRGRGQIVDGWKRFYEGAQAPFAWKPETVEVLESGTLAFTSGPVTDPEGKPAGSFNSIWRREGDGTWRVIFDKGCP